MTENLINLSLFMKHPTPLHAPNAPRFFLATAAASLLLLHPASAATLSWNTGGTSDVWTIGGDANWITSTLTDVAWTDNNAAVFNNATGEAITINGTVTPSNTNPFVTVSGGGTWSFGGSGSIAGSGVLRVSGGTLDPRLTITNSNSFTGGTSITGGAVVNVQNSGALGSGNAQVSNSGSALELQGGVTLSHTVGVSDGATLRNVSGNNVITADVTASSGGSGSNISSDAGHLTLGNVSIGGTTSTARIRGASTGEITGNITETVALSKLTKQDAGTWTLSGTNSYTGATGVTAGTLLINGDSSAATGDMTVASTATLGGTGIVGGATTVNAGGTVAAGDGGADTLTFANGLNLSTVTSKAIFEAGDLIDVTGGTLNLASAWDLTISGLGYQDGGSVTLFTYTTAGTIFTNADITLVGLGFAPTGPLTLTDTGSAIVLNGISVVPEPSAWGLIAAAGTVFVIIRRRRTQA